MTEYIINTLVFFFSFVKSSLQQRLCDKKKIALDVLTSWWVLNRGVFLLELSQITEILISTWLVLVQFRSLRASIRMVVFRMILI